MATTSTKPTVLYIRKTYAWLFFCCALLLAACASIGDPGLHHSLRFTPESTPVFALTFEYGYLKETAATLKRLGIEEDRPIRGDRILGTDQIPELLLLGWRTAQGQVRSEKIPILDLLRNESRSDLKRMWLEVKFHDEKVEVRVMYRLELKRTPKLIYVNH